MDYPELDDQLAYKKLIRKVVDCAKARYFRPGKNLYKVFALAITACIDVKDMWIIIHHNCRDVYKAFYAGSLEYYLGSPYDRFLNDCRNTFFLDQMKTGE